MTAGIFLIASALFTTAAAAPDTGHCDSKPFTLKKPGTAAPKPVAVPTAAPAPKPVAPKSTPKAKAKYELGCKQPKN